MDDGSWPVADWQETSVGVVWLSPSYLETLAISEGVASAPTVSRIVLLCVPAQPRLTPVKQKLMFVCLCL